MQLKYAFFWISVQIIWDGGKNNPDQLNDEISLLNSVFVL